MRYPGEIRRMFEATVRESGPLPMRELAHKCQVGIDAARRTLDNAVRAGDFEIVGHAKASHSKKWVAVYDLAEPVAPAPQRADDADAALMVLSVALDAWR